MTTTKIVLLIIASVIVSAIIVVFAVNPNILNKLKSNNDSDEEFTLDEIINEI